MKKSLPLLSLFFAFVTTISAQDHSNSRNSPGKYNGVSRHQTKAFSPRQGSKALTTFSAGAFTLFFEDFASGLPASWASEDAAGFGEYWKWTTTGSYNSPGGLGIRDSLSHLNTTASNGYMIFDSDSSVMSGQENSSIITPAINCAGHSSIFLNFNEYFLQYISSEGLVDVSNDSVNWIRVHNSEAGLNQNTGTSNPNSVTIDISSIAANQATVYVRFTWIGNNDWWWMLDDVRVFEPQVTDASLTDFSGVTSGCLLSSTSPVTISIQNFGGANLTNIPVFLNVNGGTPISGTIPGPVAPLSTASYTFPTTIDLSNVGLYELKAWTVVPGDSNYLNDTASIQIENFMPDNLSSPYIMDFEPGENFNNWSIEDANQDGATWGLVDTLSYSGTFSFRKTGSSDYDDDWLWSGCFDLLTGNTYKLDYWYRNGTLDAPCSLEVKLATAPNIASSSQLIASEVIDTVYTNSVNTFTVPANGTYYVAWHAFLPTSSPDSGSSSLRIDLINLSLATVLNENVNVGGVSVFPNPNNGNFGVRMMKPGQASLRIFNATGKEVRAIRIGEMITNIDLSKEAKGLYIVKVEGDGFQYSQKVTVQ